MAPPIPEYRKDGWPLCPRCGEDELYSKEIGAAKPTDRLTCYRCGWNGHVPPAPPTTLAGLTAGDLYLRAVDEWMTHAEACELEACAICDLLINRVRLARTVWQSSRHQALTPERGA